MDKYTASCVATLALIWKRLEDSKQLNDYHELLYDHSFREQIAILNEGMETAQDAIIKMIDIACNKASNKNPND